MKFDWIDDSACILICKDPDTANAIMEQHFTTVLYARKETVMSSEEESGLVWYRTKEQVEKKHDDDNYGEKGKAIHMFARICLSSDIERMQCRLLMFL